MGVNSNTANQFTLPLFQSRSNKFYPRTIISVSSEDTLDKEVERVLATSFDARPAPTPVLLDTASAMVSLGTASVTNEPVDDYETTFAFPDHVKATLSFCNRSGKPKGTTDEERQASKDARKLVADKALCKASKVMTRVAQCVQKIGVAATSVLLDTGVAPAPCNHQDVIDCIHAQLVKEHDHLQIVVNQLSEADDKCKTLEFRVKHYESEARFSADTIASLHHRIAGLIDCEQEVVNLRAEVVRQESIIDNLRASQVVAAAPVATTASHDAEVASLNAQIANLEGIMSQQQEHMRGIELLHAESLDKCTKKFELLVAHHEHRNKELLGCIDQVKHRNALLVNITENARRELVEFKESATVKLGRTEDLERKWTAVRHLANAIEPAGPTLVAVAPQPELVQIEINNDDDDDRDEEESVDLPWVYPLPAPVPVAPVVEQQAVIENNNIDAAPVAPVSIVATAAAAAATAAPVPLPITTPAELSVDEMQEAIIRGKPIHLDNDEDDDIVVTLSAADCGVVVVAGNKKASSPKRKRDEKQQQQQQQQSGGQRQQSSLPSSSKKAKKPIKNNNNNDDDENSGYDDENNGDDEKGGCDDCSDDESSAEPSAYYTLPSRERSGVASMDYTLIVQRLGFLGWRKVPNFDKLKHVERRVVVGSVRTHNAKINLAENAKALVTLGCYYVAIDDLNNMLTNLPYGQEYTDATTLGLLKSFTQPRNAQCIKTRRFKLQRGVMLASEANKAWLPINHWQKKNKCAADDTEEVVIRDELDFWVVFRSVCNLVKSNM